MSSVNTTDFGVVMQWMLTRLGGLVPATVKQVQGGTSDSLAVTAPKTFPCLALVWKGRSLTNAVDRLGGAVPGSGRFASRYRALWDLHHFSVTGLNDDAAMFAALTLAHDTAERLHGQMPGGQAGNAYQLFCDADTEIERFRTGGGSGGMKVISSYYLEQVIGTV